MKGTKKKEWIAIVNPNAGVGKGKRDWKKISAIMDYQNLSYEAVFTQRRDHAVKLTKEYIEKGYRKIISVGGDGTLNEVVNGIFHQNLVPTHDITLAVVSVGTGNDWIRTFMVPVDYKDSIALITKEDTFIQDAGMVSFSHEKGMGTRYFINMAGLGFDGLVAQKTNADKELGKANPLVYFKNIFASLFAYKSVATRIVIDNTEMHHKVFTLAVGIGQFNGGGMKQTPDAVPDDGFFDLTLIKDMSKWSVIANVNRLYNGTIKKHKKVEVHKGRNIVIEPKIPVLIEVDGESIGHSPFNFTILPKSLKVVINRKKFKPFKENKEK